jgi:predicted transcriptional regulator
MKTKFTINIFNTLIAELESSIDSLENELQWENERMEKAKKELYGKFKNISDDDMKNDEFMALIRTDKTSNLMGLINTLSNTLRITKNTFKEIIQ